MYIKRQLLFLIVLLFAAIGANAQDSQPVVLDTIPWDQCIQCQGLELYRVEFMAVEESCPNNGGVKFRIVRKENGQPITPADTELIKLSYFHISHKANMGTDTSTHSVELLEYDLNAPDGWQYVQLERGRFKVTMACIYSKRNDPTVKYEVVTDTTLEILKTYTEPKFSIMSAPSYDGVRKGNIPTLDCDTTGRMQLEIVGGVFPDTVRYYRDEDPSQQYMVIFNDYQNHGTHPDSANYQYNYTFENMMAGTWNFSLDDGCHQHKHYITQTLGTTSLPRLDHIQVWAFSQNIYDANIIRITAVMNTQYDCYVNQFAPYMKYYFEIPAQGRPNDPDYKPALQNQDPNQAEWLPFPADGHFSVTLADTVIRAVDYCDLINRDIKFHFKVDSAPFSRCSAWDTTVVFSIFHPARGSFYPEDYETPINTEHSSPDPCSPATIYQRQNISIHHSSFNRGFKIDYTESRRDTVHRYHFTYPLTWEFWDYDRGNLIKTVTIENDFELEVAELTYSDMDNYYFERPTLTKPNYVHIQRRLVDAKGCQVYLDETVDQCFNMRLIEDTVGTSGPRWKATTVAPECCSEMRSIKLVEMNSANVDYDGLTIELIQSPDDNLYNFKYVYDASSLSWSHSGINVNNPATILPDGYGRSLEMSGLCLPSGFYYFQISNAPCNADTLIKVYLGKTVVTEMAEDFDYISNDSCGKKVIKITAGRVAAISTRVKSEREGNVTGNNSLVVRDTTYLTTIFELKGGPTGGYDPRSSHTYHIGDSLIFSFPSGNTPYKIEIRPNQNKCGSFKKTVEIDYEDTSLGFDIAAALLCNRDDEEGDAYVRACNGIPPYDYTLYTNMDMTDQMAYAHITDKDSIVTFKDLHFNATSQLCCKVEDACGDYFLVPITPMVLAELQLAWADPQKRHTCEGDSVRLYALQYGLIFRYSWTAPDGTEFANSPNPSVFIPRGAQAGVYTVTISQTGCDDNDLTAQVYIDPEKAPDVHLALETDLDEVCPGDKVQVNFTLESASEDPDNLITFRVAYQDLLGTEYRTYKGHHGDVIRDSLYPRSRTWIYTDQIEEENSCGYYHADDTLVIEFQDNMLDPCKIHTTNDLVCKGLNAQLTASCTEDGPLTMRWYTDYEMTNLLREPTTGLARNEVDEVDLPGLETRTILYVSVASDEKCPTLNNAPNGTFNMGDEEVKYLTCTDQVLFYDAGGDEGGYEASLSNLESFSQLFVSAEPGHPLTIHFDQMNLGEMSQLCIFTGGQPVEDSLLFKFTADANSANGGELPPVFTTNCDTMLVYLTPRQSGGGGWRAIVQPTPGIAIADVLLPTTKYFSDYACQSHSNTYSNTELINTLDIPGVTVDNLTQKMREAGTYTFKKTVPSTVPDKCDSTVYFTFVVNPAPIHETVRVIALQTVDDTTGFRWYNVNDPTRDSLYREPGIYAANFPDEESGCDYYEVLNLIVIKIDNEDQDFCVGTPAVVGITVETFDSTRPRSSLIEERHMPGDVLCLRDGAYKVFRAQDFVNTWMDSGWVAQAVVVYIDPENNLHGKAIALKDSRSERLTTWAPKNFRSEIHAVTMVGSQQWNVARREMNGKANTEAIVRSADTAAKNHQKIAQDMAPAAYSCYEYDPSAKGLWYLPACGEWLYSFAYRVDVNASLKLLRSKGYDAAPLSGNFDDNYWTSTEVDANNAVCVNGKGQIIMHHTKNCEHRVAGDYAYKVRPMIEFGK